MLLGRITLEAVDSSLLRILDENEEGAVVATTTLEAETDIDLFNAAARWAETEHLDLENNVYARYGFKFMGVRAFGGSCKLDGYASCRYRRGGVNSGQGGFLLMVEWDDHNGLVV